jgi:hypothetical protein
MIDMGVRKDQRVYSTRIVCEVQISNIGFATASLIQATVQQEAVSIDLQQMLTSRHGMRRAVKIDPHLSLLLIGKSAGHNG